MTSRNNDMFAIRKPNTGTRGTVRAFNIRSEKEATLRGQRDIFVWSFRLEQHDADGSPLLFMPVELRGHTIEGGRLNDGDEVAVTGTVRNGTLIARSIVDVQTGSVVRPTGRALSRTITILGLIAILAFAGIPLLTATGLWDVLIGQLAIWGSVSLEDCYVYLERPTQLSSLPLAGAHTGVTELPGRYRASRRADSYFGSRNDYEILVGNVRGWVSSVYVVRFEGACLPQSPTDSLDIVPTDNPNDCYLYLQSGPLRRTPDPFTMDYIILPVFSRLRAFRTVPHYFLSGDHANMVEVEHEGRRYWILQTNAWNPEGNCSWLIFTPTPTPADIVPTATPTAISSYLR